MASKMHYLFVGNPGVGKSTMLNGLLGECRFHSGFSPGKGMTDRLQKEEKNGSVYMDTPGLADVEMRQLAAEAITQALKQNGSYRIFFVLTLEAGRVRPADKSTMELVLNSAPIGDNYGVIFNKLTKAAKREIDADASVKDKILASLFASCKATRFIHYLANDGDLEDEKNVVKPLPELLEKFITNMPPIEIKPEAVQEIKGNEFEAIEKKYEQMLKQMEGNSKMLQQQLQAQQQQMLAQEQRFAEQARESAELRQQIRAMEEARCHSGGGGCSIL